MRQSFPVDPSSNQRGEKKTDGARGTDDGATSNHQRDLLMNGILDSVELKMLEELMRRGAVVGSKHFDKKKYLKELVRCLYLNL